MSKVKDEAATIMAVEELDEVALMKKKNRGSSKGPEIH